MHTDFTTYLAKQIVDSAYLSVNSSMSIYKEEAKPNVVAIKKLDKLLEKFSLVVTKQPTLSINKKKPSENICIMLSSFLPLIKEEKRTDYLGVIYAAFSLSDSVAYEIGEKYTFIKVNKTLYKKMFNRFDRIMNFFFSSAIAIGFVAGLVLVSRELNLGLEKKLTENFNIDINRFVSQLGFSIFNDESALVKAVFNEIAFKQNVVSFFNKVISKPKLVNIITDEDKFLREFLI